MLSLHWFQLTDIFPRKHKLNDFNLVGLFNFKLKAPRNTQPEDSFEEPYMIKWSFSR